MTLRPSVKCVAPLRFRTPCTSKKDQPFLEGVPGVWELVPHQVEVGGARGRPVVEARHIRLVAHHGCIIRKKYAGVSL